MKNFIKLWYFIGTIINLLTTLLLIIVLFFDKTNIINNKQILFLLWLNLSTHITERTKHIQKET